MDHTLLQSCGSHLHSDCRTTLQYSKCVRNAYVVCAAPGRMPDFRMQSQDHSSSLISVTYIISSLFSHIPLSSLTSLFPSFLLFSPVFSSSLVSLYFFILSCFQYIAYHHSNKLYHFLLGERKLLFLTKSNYRYHGITIIVKACENFSRLIISPEPSFNTVFLKLFDLVCENYLIYFIDIYWNERFPIKCTVWHDFSLVFIPIRKNIYVYSVNTIILYLRYYSLIAFVANTNL